MNDVQDLEKLSRELPEELDLSWLKDNRCVVIHMHSEGIDYAGVSDALGIVLQKNQEAKKVDEKADKTKIERTIVDEMADIIKLEKTLNIEYSSVLGGATHFNILGSNEADFVHSAGYIHGYNVFKTYISNNDGNSLIIGIEDSNPVVRDDLFSKVCRSTGIHPILPVPSSGISKINMTEQSIDYKSKEGFTIESYKSNPFGLIGKELCNRLQIYSQDSKLKPNVERIVAGEDASLIGFACRDDDCFLGVLYSDEEVRINQRMPLWMNTARD